MKQRIARICLVVSVFLFFTGFLVLCYCPGWYVLAAAFAGVSAGFGTGRMRTWGILWVVASLAFSVIHTYAKIRETEKVRAIKQRYEERQRLNTNQSAPTN